MTTFHVLTGLHAGASLPLKPGRYRVTGETDADKTHADEIGHLSTAVRITLLDWPGTPLDFQVEAGGSVTVGPHGADIDVAPTDAWPLQESRRFGPITLCVRTDDAVAANELAPCNPAVRPASSETRTRKLMASESAILRKTGSWARRACFAGAGLFVAVSALYGHTATFEAKPDGKAGFDCEWLSHNLVARGLDELRVQKLNDVVTLSGLVRNAAQGQSARTAAAEFLRGSPGTVLARWEIADDIASTIETALRQPGVHAVYAGGGRFRVEGLVADPDTFQAAAHPLLKDLGPNVKGVDFSLRAAHRPVPVNAAMVAGSLQYSERPDGAKVFPRDAKGI